MANLETKLIVNDIVVVRNYYDEIGTGVVKNINISSKGIMYDVAMGFICNEEAIIKLHEQESDSSVYHLVSVVGNLGKLEIL